MNEDKKSAKMPLVAILATCYFGTIFVPDNEKIIIPAEIAWDSVGMAIIGLIMVAYKLIKR